MPRTVCTEIVKEVRIEELTRHELERRLEELSKKFDDRAVENTERILGAISARKDGQPAAPLGDKTVPDPALLEDDEDQVEQQYQMFMWKGGTIIIRIPLNLRSYYEFHK